MGKSVTPVTSVTSVIDDAQALGLLADLARDMAGYGGIWPDRGDIVRYIGIQRER